jgi:hypothetical protein
MDSYGFKREGSVGTGRASLLSMDPEYWLHTRETREQSIVLHKRAVDSMSLQSWKTKKGTYNYPKYRHSRGSLKEAEESMKPLLDLVPCFKRGEVIKVEMIQLMEKLDYCLRKLSEDAPVISAFAPLFTLTSLPRKLLFYEWMRVCYTSLTSDVFDSLVVMCRIVKNKKLEDKVNWAHRVRKMFDKEVLSKYGGVKEIRMLPDGNYSSYTECPICLSELSDSDSVIRPCCGLNACRTCADVLKDKTCSVCRSEPCRNLDEVKVCLRTLASRGSEWAVCELIKEESDVLTALGIADEFIRQNESHSVVNFYRIKLLIEVESLKSVSTDPETYSGESWAIDMLLYTVSESLKEESSKVFLNRASVSGAPSAGFKIIEGLPERVRIEMLKSLVMSRDLVARRFYGLEIMKTLPDIALAYLMSYKSNLVKVECYKGEDEEVNNIIKLSLDLLSAICCECACKTPPLNWCKCGIVKLCHCCSHHGCKEVLIVLNETGLRTDMMSGRDHDYRNRPSWLGKH